MHTKTIERCEQTQICPGLCELRRESFIRVQCFHLSEEKKSTVIPSCLIPSNLFINVKDQGPKGEGLEENKKHLEIWVHLEILCVLFQQTLVLPVRPFVAKTKVIHTDNKYTVKLVQRQ